MGTRGFYCFRHKGLYYVIYNHYDSYPEGLGMKLVNQLRKLDPQELRKLIDNSILINLNEDIQEKRFPILSPDLIEKFRKMILQDSAYLVSIKQYYKGLQEETIDDESIWLDNNFDSQESKWRFIFVVLFSNQTLQIDKALSFGFLPVDCAPDINPPENDLWIEWIYFTETPDFMTI